MLGIRDEELTECAEEQEEVDMKSIQGYWRRRNEILPLVTKEDIYSCPQTNKNRNSHTRLRRV